MPIRKLPDYMINRLKAGEIVERPASVIKELVENSLDAGATFVKIIVNDGGKSLLSVEDNGVGIELSDMDLLLERYATSKINGEQDLYSLQSYGFRGEALASISEVSKITVISKTAYAEIGTKLTKIDQQIVVKHVPVGFSHGTIVSVSDLFYTVPARLKFLKSSQTEYFYCYHYFVDVALFHYDKHFVLLKNDKVAFDLPPVASLHERVSQIWKKDRSQHLYTIDQTHQYLHLKGVVSDSSLTFSSAETIKIYVNGRPVSDKIIKKALMDTYDRQIAYGDYPFAILFLMIKPSFIDVNVHPKKSEVKFLEPSVVFSFIQDALRHVFAHNKITDVSSSTSFSLMKNEVNFGQEKLNKSVEGDQKSLFSSTAFSSPSVAFSSSFQDASLFSQQSLFHEQLGNYFIVGQIWQRYIVLSTEDALFYVDQHALAERIAFEKMKKASLSISSELLLQPLSVDVPLYPDLQQKIDQLISLGFDCSLLSETKVIVYAIPQIFSVYKIDIERLFISLFGLESLTFDHILDTLFATKACKISIKAGDFLSYEQMVQLIQDGFSFIEGMFVCQHGRPFFVKIGKKTIDTFFDR